MGGCFRCLRFLVPLLSQCQFGPSVQVLVQFFHSQIVHYSLLQFFRAVFLGVSCFLPGPGFGVVLGWSVGWRSCYWSVCRSVVCHGQSTVIRRVLRVGITGNSVCLAAYHWQMDFSVLRQCLGSASAVEQPPTAITRTKHGQAKIDQKLPLTATSTRFS